MLDSNTLYTVFCLFEHIFFIPKKLEFQTTIFLCAATLHEAIFHLLYMFKEHYKNRKFEVPLFPLSKKNRSLLQTFDNAIPLYWNANFITNKVTVLCIYVAFPHVSLGVLECMHAWQSVRVCNCLMKCINFMKIKFDTKSNKGIPVYY